LGAAGLLGGCGDPADDGVGANAPICQAAAARATSSRRQAERIAITVVVSERNSLNTAHLPPPT
jgi:4-hydroxy-3-methylbut-2-enyl diphosphate reductase IspH